MTRSKTLTKSVRYAPFIQWLRSNKGKEFGPHGDYRERLRSWESIPDPRIGAFLAKQKNGGRFFGLSVIDRFNLAAPARVRIHDVHLKNMSLMYGIFTRVYQGCGPDHEVTHSLRVQHLSSISFVVQMSLYGTLELDAQRTERTRLLDWRYDLTSGGADLGIF